MKASIIEDDELSGLGKCRQMAVEIPSSSHNPRPLLLTFLLSIAQKLKTGDLNSTLPTVDKSGLGKVDGLRVSNTGHPHPHCPMHL
jgi:hypothetical protein